MRCLQRLIFDELMQVRNCYYLKPGTGNNNSTVIGINKFIILLEEADFLYLFTWLITINYLLGVLSYFLG